MKVVQDIHTTLACILGITLSGLLWSISNTKWWSCSTGGEPVLQLWTYGTIGLIAGTITAIVARHYGHGIKLKYGVEVMVKLLFIYALITVAMIKTEGEFFDLNLITREYKLSDLESSTFASAFYGYSPFFQSFNGAILIAGLFSLCFQRLERLGTIVLAAALTNSVILNHSFDSCFLMKNSIYLSAVAYLIFNDIFGWAAFITKRNTTPKYTWTPFSKNKHINTSLAVYKVILLIGLAAYNHEQIKDIKDYRGRNKNNPIAGVWNVEKIEYLAGDMPDQTKKELEDFDRIILDKDRFGAVAVDDSLSYFEFIVNPQDNQLEFWNFYDYRELDIKGKYHQVAPDTLLYIGRNNKDSLQIIFTLDKH